MTRFLVLAAFALGLILPASEIAAQARRQPAQTLGPIKTPVLSTDGPDTADLLNLRVAPPSNGFWTRSGGPLLDYCAAAGCYDGPHLLTQSYFRATTRPYSNAQQVGIAADFYSTHGYLPKWKANTVYRNTQPSVPTATSEVHVGDAFDAKMYRNSVDNCTSGTTGPTGTGSNIVDGTCRWIYIGDGLNSGGTGVAFNTRIKPGGGNTWGFITNIVAEAGIGDGIVYGQEFDCDNRNKESVAGGAFGMVCLYFGGGGPTNFPSLAALYVDNSLANDATAAQPYGYQYGVVVGGQPGTRGSVAKQAAFTDWSHAQFSFWAIGDRTHTAAFRDDSNSATVLSAAGTHQIGIDLTNANFSTNTAIRVKDDIAMTAGLLRPAQYTVAGAPPCGASTKGAMIVFTDVAGMPSYRLTGFSGGGTQAVPGFCNGGSWELH